MPSLLIALHVHQFIDIFFIYEAQYFKVKKKMNKALASDKLILFDLMICFLYFY